MRFSILCATAVAVAVSLVIATFASASTTYEFYWSNPGRALRARQSGSQLWLPVCADSTFTAATAANLCKMAGMNTTARSDGASSPLFVASDNVVNPINLKGDKAVAAGVSCGKATSFTDGCSVTTWRGKCSAMKAVKMMCDVPAAPVLASDAANAPQSGMYIGGQNGTEFYSRLVVLPGSTTTPKQTLVQVRTAFTSTWKGVCYNKDLGSIVDAESATMLCRAMAYNVTWASVASAGTSYTAATALAKLQCGWNARAMNNHSGCSYRTGVTCSASALLGCQAQTYGISAGNGITMRITKDDSALQVIPQQQSMFGSVCAYPNKQLDNKTASAVCTMLGYVNGGVSKTWSGPAAGATAPPVKASGLSCPSATTASLSFCKITTKNLPTQCGDHKNDVTVLCNLRGALADPIVVPVPSPGGGSGGATGSSIFNRPGLVALVFCIPLACGICMCATVFIIHKRRKAAQDVRKEIAETEGTSDGDGGYHKAFVPTQVVDPAAHQDLQVMVGDHYAGGDRSSSQQPSGSYNSNQPGDDIPL